MNNKKELYTIAGVIAGVVLLLILGCILPLFLGIKHTSESLFSQKESGMVLEDESMQIENFKKEYPGYQSNLEKAGQLFVDPKNPVDVIKFFESISSSSNVSSKISLGPVPPEESQHIVAFQIVVSSDFLNVLSFLEKLEHGPYLVDVKNIIIKGSYDQNDPKKTPLGKVDATLTVNTFAKP
ncbi:hypothetical protein KW786_03035 [Candidatus Parcubacteria bacterium]|nr:hypothetical protein [Candidatus Parcubacteria bacterium]